MRITIFLISLLFITACGDKNDFDAVGVITGIDGTECYCCGGHFIEVGENEFRTFSFSEIGEFTDDNFPITIKLNWVDDTSDCENIASDLIVVEDYAVE